MSKKKIREKRIQTVVMICYVILIFLFGMLVQAAIRMTNDPKPHKAVYQVKDVNTGILTTKYETEDQDFDFKIGDFYEEASTNYPNGDSRFTVMHKWVVVGIKHVK